MRILLVLLLPIFMLSCEGVTPASSDEYFDVSGLLEDQYELLSTGRAALSKLAIMGDDTAVVQISPDSVRWKDELVIFERIDINKPKWRGQYQVITEEDKFSNLQVRTFITENKQAEVKYLKLYYLGEVANLRRIEAEWQENNPIYKSQRKLTLLFEDISGDIVISGYRIDGEQKMMLQEAVSFKIEVEATYP